MRTEEECARTIREIQGDYAYNPDIFCEDSERVTRLKQIINTKLTPVDRTIILLYTDCMSYRKLGERLHLSHMTVRRECLRIKKIILDEYGGKPVH